MRNLVNRSSTVAVVASAALIFLGNAAHAKPMDWRTDFQQAARESQATGKPLLIVFTASWCHWCHKMADQTFGNPQIMQRVDEEYIPVLVDVDARRDLYDRAGANGLPTILVASAELKPYRKITGFQTPAQLTAELNQIRLPKTEPKIVEQVAESRPVAEPTPLFTRHCLVSLMDDRTLQEGLRNHSTLHKGVTLYFASAGHKQAFLDQPSRYWPAWSGYCAVSVVDENVVRAGVPELGCVYRGRLWFFADESRRDKFMATPSEYLRLRTTSAQRN
jgi:YHS domain-containing protein/thiol-disulfide isomerase/thioredoxin